MKNQIKNQISDTLRNYFKEVIKNTPKLEWKDNKINTPIVCSTSTQFGEFTIKKCYDEPGYYTLCLNDNPQSSYTYDINELIDLANYLYRQKITKALKI